MLRIQNYECSAGTGAANAYTKRDIEIVGTQMFVQARNKNVLSRSQSEIFL